MISHLPLRLAASAITLAVVAAPTPGRCRPVPAAMVQPATQMEHISIVGHGSPVVPIPGGFLAG